jgi:hypothetical protein
MDTGQGSGLFVFVLARPKLQVQLAKVELLIAEEISIFPGNLPTTDRPTSRP